MCQLIVLEAISRTKRDVRLFFQEAYYWKYQKRYECINDFHAYREKLVIPAYVIEYAKHILST